MDTKERILEASLKLFIKKGFTDVSMNELLVEVELTKGGFYHYFESKNQLLDEVIKKYVFSFLDILIKDEIKIDLPLEEKIKHIFHSVYKYEEMIKKEINDSEINFRSFYLLLMEGVKKFPELSNYYCNFQNNIVLKIQAILEREKENGTLPIALNIKDAAFFIFSCQEGIVMSYVINPVYDIEILIERNVNFVISSLKNI